MVPSDNDLCLELRTILDRARHDAAVFAVLTVILTPFFVTAAVILLFVVLWKDIRHLRDAPSLVTGINLSLTLMVASYFIRPKPPYQRNRRDWIWVSLGLGFLCVLLGFSYATPLVKTHPSYFWPVYLFLALAMVGCMGHAYEPREDYYLGWMMGPIPVDNPFTFEDDIDRAHVMLGFIGPLPNLIMESYAGIFGNTWLWRGLDEQEVWTAVRLLQALAANDARHADTCVRALSKASALRVVRALVKLHMITIDRRRPRLCLKGREFLGLKDSQ